MLTLTKNRISKPQDLFDIFQRSLMKAKMRGEYQKKDALIDVLDYIIRFFSKDRTPEEYLRSTRALYDTSYLKISYGKGDSVFGWVQLRRIIKENDLLSLESWKNA